MASNDVISGGERDVETGCVTGTSPCYCRGTQIFTDRGEVAVENLRIGDRLVTAFGTLRPIRWIGRRAYSGRFAASNPGVCPVQFRPGALADGIPRRDLFVSPGHALFLDGMLVPAGALVNGVSIVQLGQEEIESIGEIEYFHVEMQTHDVILAEGAPAETFVDDNSRGRFHNAAEYARLYPDAVRKPVRICAPRLESGPALEALRRKLATRCAPPKATPGLLLGFVELVDRARIQGWAQDESGAPVRLQITDNGLVLARVVASAFRADLAQAGIGDGCHSFDFAVPGGLSPRIRHVIAVRRASDGGALHNSPWVLEAEKTCRSLR